MGKLRKSDGPVIQNDGDQWHNIDPERVNNYLNNLTDEDKQMIALYWSNYGK